MTSGAESSPTATHFALAPMAPMEQRVWTIVQVFLVRVIVLLTPFAIGAIMLAAAIAVTRVFRIASGWSGGSVDLWVSVSAALWIFTVMASYLTFRRTAMLRYDVTREYREKVAIEHLMRERLEFRSAIEEYQATIDAYRTEISNAMDAQNKEVRATMESLRAQVMREANRYLRNIGEEAERRAFKDANWTAGLRRKPDLEESQQRDRVAQEALMRELEHLTIQLNQLARRIDALERARGQDR